MSRRSGHRQLDHTADLALELWAASQEALLEEAARAVIGILSPDGSPRATVQRSLTLTALDEADRLVRWMNEILALALLEGFLTVSADVQLDGAQRLRAVLDGEPDAFDHVTTELKSVTYHDLRLEQVEDRWQAHVVIDV